MQSAKGVGLRLGRGFFERLGLDGPNHQVSVGQKAARLRLGDDAIRALQLGARIGKGLDHVNLRRLKPLL